MAFIQDPLSPTGLAGPGSQTIAPQLPPAPPASGVAAPPPQLTPAGAKPGPADPAAMKMQAQQLAAQKMSAYQRATRLVRKMAQLEEPPPGPMPPEPPPMADPQMGAPPPGAPPPGAPPMGAPPPNPAMPRPGMNGQPIYDPMTEGPVVGSIPEQSAMPSAVPSPASPQPLGQEQVGQFPPPPKAASVAPIASRRVALASLLKMASDFRTYEMGEGYDYPGMKPKWGKYRVDGIEALQDLEDRIIPKKVSSRSGFKFASVKQAAPFQPDLQIPGDPTGASLQQMLAGLNQQPGGPAAAGGGMSMPDMSGFAPETQRAIGDVSGVMGTGARGLTNDAVNTATRPGRAALSAGNIAGIGANDALNRANTAGQLRADVMSTGAKGLANQANTAARIGGTALDQGAGKAIETAKQAPRDAARAVNMTGNTAATGAKGLANTAGTAAAIGGNALDRGAASAIRGAATAPGDAARAANIAGNTTATGAQGLARQARTGANTAAAVGQTGLSGLISQLRSAGNLASTATQAGAKGLANRAGTAAAVGGNTLDRGAASAIRGAATAPGDIARAGRLAGSTAATGAQGMANKAITGANTAGATAVAGARGAAPATTGALLGVPPLVTPTSRRGQAGPAAGGMPSPAEPSSMANFARTGQKAPGGADPWAVSRGPDGSNSIAAMGARPGAPGRAPAPAPGVMGGTQARVPAGAGASQPVSIPGPSPANTAVNRTAPLGAAGPLGSQLGAPRPSSFAGGIGAGLGSLAGGGAPPPGPSPAMAGAGKPVPTGGASPANMNMFRRPQPGVMPRIPLPLLGKTSSAPVPDISPFAAAFYLGCREKGLGNGEIREAIKTASEVSEDFAKELGVFLDPACPVLEKQAGPEQLLGRLGGLFNAAKGFGNTVKGWGPALMKLLGRGGQAAGGAGRAGQVAGEAAQAAQTAGRAGQAAGGAAQAAGRAGQAAGQAAKTVVLPNDAAATAYNNASKVIGNLTHNPAAGARQIPLQAPPLPHMPPMRVPPGGGGGGMPPGGGRLPSGGGSSLIPPGGGGGLSNVAQTAENAAPWYRKMPGATNTARWLVNTPLGGLGGMGTGELINAGIEGTLGEDYRQEWLPYALGAAGGLGRSPWGRKGLGMLPKAMRSPMRGAVSTITGGMGSGKGLFNWHEGGGTPRWAQRAGQGASLAGAGLMGAGIATGQDWYHPAQAMRNIRSDQLDQTLQENFGMSLKDMQNHPLKRVYDAFQQGGIPSAIAAGWGELTPQQKTGLITMLASGAGGLALAASGQPGLGAGVGLGGAGLGGYMMYQGGGNPAAGLYQGASPEVQKQLQDIIGSNPQFGDQMQGMSRSNQHAAFQDLINQLQQQQGGTEMARSSGQAMPAQAQAQPQPAG